MDYKHIKNQKKLKRIRCWYKSNSSNRINWIIKKYCKCWWWKLNFFQCRLTVLKKIRNYQEARVKQTNTLLQKLKPAAKFNTGAALRINFQDDQLPHELFLNTRQKTKIKKAFSNNMLTGKKLSTSQLVEIIQSDRFLGKKFGNLGKADYTKIYLYQNECFLL